MNINWRKSFSKNFIYYYLPESMAEKNLSEIKDSEENLLIKLEKFLAVKNPKKINLYLYPSLTLKKKHLGGTSPGFSHFEGRKIAYVYNNKFPKMAIAHEETHILCFEWDKPSSFIENQYIISTASFYEGLAMYAQSKFFNRYFNRYSLTAKPPKGMTLNQAIKDDIINNCVPRIKEILMYEGYCHKLKNGAQLGSISEFLIEIYSLDKFKELFIKLSESKTQAENELFFKTVYGKNIETLDSEWRSYVVNKTD